MGFWPSAGKRHRNQDLHGKQPRRVRSQFHERYCNRHRLHARSRFRRNRYCCGRIQGFHGEILAHHGRCLHGFAGFQLHPGNQIGSPDRHWRAAPHRHQGHRHHRALRLPHLHRGHHLAERGGRGHRRGDLHGAGRDLRGKSAGDHRQRQRRRPYCVPARDRRQSCPHTHRRDRHFRLQG